MLLRCTKHQQIILSVCLWNNLNVGFLSQQAQAQTFWVQVERGQKSRMEQCPESSCSRYGVNFIWEGASHNSISSSSSCKYDLKQTCLQPWLLFLIFLTVVFFLSKCKHASWRVLSTRREALSWFTRSPDIQLGKRTGAWMKFPVYSSNWNEGAKRACER